MASADVLDTIDRINAEPAQLRQILEEAQVSEEDAAILGSFQLLTQIQDLSIIDQSTGHRVEGLTNVTLTWEVPNLTSEMKNIRVLHYSTVRNVWEILNPDKVDFENKAITQTFRSSFTGGRAVYLGWRRNRNVTRHWRFHAGGLLCRRSHGGIRCVHNSRT